MTPPTPTPHTTLFRQFYTWLGNLTFFHWNKYLNAVIGGLLLLLVPTLIVKLVPLWVAVLLLSTAGNIVWGLRLNPNDAGKPSELPSGLIREGVILLGIWLLARVGVL